MPIVNPTSLDTATLPQVTYVTTINQTDVVTKRLSVFLPHNVSDYSHSTVFTTFHYGPLSSMDTVDLENKPPLTTFFIATNNCYDRWILHETSEAIFTSMPNDGSDTTMATSLTGPEQIFTLVFNTLPTSSEAEYDMSYIACQPYTMTPIYSPAICPKGQTIAEITEHHVSEGEATTRWWQASCCKSGMTFGTEWPEACVSHFSTGLSAYAPVPFNQTILPVYELTTQFLVNGISSTTTISNVKSVATGIAIADPVIVGWEEHDLSTFPTEYANSLAQRIGVSLPSTTGPTATTGTTARGSEPTGPTNSSRLSTGAKAGIGVGVAIVVFLIALVLFLLHLLRAKKNRSTAAPEGTAELEDQDQHNASRYWFLQRKGRSEVEGETPREIDSTTVRVVPGPPVELGS